MTLPIEALDALTCGEFIPYRDSSDRPCLLDVQPSSGVSPRARPLYRKLAAVVKAGMSVVDETSYRAWLFDHWESFISEIHAAKLGVCIGDEGHTLLQLHDQVLDAVWRPGWRAE